MKGSSDRVLECTTGQFDGTIALIAPSKSWVVSLVWPPSIRAVAKLSFALDRYRRNGKGMINIFQEFMR